MSDQYKKTVTGTIGAGMKSVFAGGGKKYYILEHKVSSSYHRAGESQEIIVDQIELGRDPHCQVRFDDNEKFKTVSRRHAAIMRDGDGWKLVQLSSTNKTLLNGVPIEKEWFLQNGDEIQLSVNGPKLGFIIPQGDKSTTKSIALSRRLSLFRQQALRPYKTAMVILAALLVAAIAAGTFFIVKGNQENKELRRMYYEDSVRRAAEIDSLNVVIQKMGIDNQKFLNSLKNVKPAKQESNRSGVDNIKIVIEETADDVAPEIAPEPIQEVMPEETPTATPEATPAEQPEAKPAEKAEATPEAKPAAVPAAVESTPKKTGVPKSVSDNIYYIQVVSYTIEMDDQKYTVRPGEVIGEGDEAMQVDGWVGTAFLLSDGRLVTARHCVEGWYYDLAKGSDWLLQLNSLATEGYKISVRLGGVSPKGDKIFFTSDEMKFDRSKDKKRTFSDGTILTFASQSDFDDLDYAWYKTDLKGGLVFDQDLCKKLKTDTELKIYGYPHGWGTTWDNTGIKNVRPIMGKGEVAVDGLQNNIILVGSASFESGHSGSPVFYIDKDGNFTVVGIVSAKTEIYGFIVPISKIN